ncbi:MAG: hypothetical protein KC731_36000, partial [Myxococcales bacterium]|nr:hypothetical protein [Myxococcales bacterium]
CRYQVTGPDGQALPLAWFSLDRAYFGLDGYYRGHPEPHRGARRAPPTIDVFGEVPDEARVVRAVQAGLARFEHLPEVVVTQEIIGAKDDQRIGVVERRVFEVQRPGAAP